MSLQKLGTVYNMASPSKSPYSAAKTSQDPTTGVSGAVVEKHVDVDALLEDYAWKYFEDMRSIKGSGLEQFKGLRKEEVDFVIVSFNLFFYFLYSQ